MTTMSQHQQMYFTANPAIRWLHERRVEGIVARASRDGAGKEVGRSARVLEVGCGIGVLLGRLPGQKFGVDIDAQAIRQAKERLGKKAVIRKAGADRLPFADGYFDAVVCSEVMEHLHRPKKAADEMLRVCKKGGRVVISVPNETCATVGRAVMLRWPPKIADHVNDFSIDDMEKLFGRTAREVGFVPPIAQPLCIWKMMVFQK